MVPGSHGKGTTAMAENAQGSAKEERLRQRMAELGILEEDLVEKFVQGGGPGGQKINKTASCVCLHYEPAEGAAIDVKCQRTRSLALNRYYARAELCERVAERIEYVFESGAKIWEQVEYLPALDDGDKYLINAEAGIESPLDDRLSLRVVLKDRYNSQPGDDNEKNDLSLTAGVRIKL